MFYFLNFHTMLLAFQKEYLDFQHMLRNNMKVFLTKKSAAELLQQQQQQVQQFMCTFFQLVCSFLLNLDFLANDIKPNEPALLLHTGLSSSTAQKYIQECNGWCVFCSFLFKSVNPQQASSLVTKK